MFWTPEERPNPDVLPPGLSKVVNCFFPGVPPIIWMPPGETGADDGPLAQKHARLSRNRSPSVALLPVERAGNLRDLCANCGTVSQTAAPS